MNYTYWPGTYTLKNKQSSSSCCIFAPCIHWFPYIATFIGLIQWRLSGSGVCNYKFKSFAYTFTLFSTQNNESNDHHRTLKRRSTTSPVYGSLPVIGGLAYGIDANTYALVDWNGLVISAPSTGPFFVCLITGRSTVHCIYCTAVKSSDNNTNAQVISLRCILKALKIFNVITYLEIRSKEKIGSLLKTIQNLTYFALKYFQLLYLYGMLIHFSVCIKTDVNGKRNKSIHTYTFATFL